MIAPHFSFSLPFCTPPLLPVQLHQPADVTGARLATGARIPQLQRPSASPSRRLPCNALAHPPLPALALPLHRPLLLPHLPHPLATQRLRPLLPRLLLRPSPPLPRLPHHPFRVARSRTLAARLLPAPRLPHLPQLKHRCLRVARALSLPPHPHPPRPSRLPLSAHPLPHDARSNQPGSLLALLPYHPLPPLQCAKPPRSTLLFLLPPAHSWTGTRRRRYVDVRSEMAAARADMVAACDDFKALRRTAEWKLKKAHAAATKARRTHGEFALASIQHAVVLVRAAMSLCRCVQVALREANARIRWHEALVDACAAAKAEGFFTAALDEAEEEGERDGERDGGESEVEELVGFIPENNLPADLADVSETLLGEETGRWPAFVAVSQEEARALLHALMEQLVVQMAAMAR
ncbi:unnamed protein product [Closterium sp. Yama58-4]|nr:unnamed protein product [Closterium sp. Yama58-4]